MKCPLLSIIKTGVPEERIDVFEDCLKEECAWWDVDTGMCAVRAYVEQLESIGQWLYEIEKKMPHEGQFRK